METRDRIESGLVAAVDRAASHECPARLAEAVRHAVFPGGARVRPRLCLAVALACGDDAPELADAAAVSIELLHCASLVHDDLPCFDNASIRRGKPSVHRQFGERLAVLTGDALIVMSFQTLGAVVTAHRDRVSALLGTIAYGVAMPVGIVAGQAWECESRVSLTQYQRAKTGALFCASTMAGALAAGADAAPWRALGEWLGEAYQVADDIRDVVADESAMGKPAGQDALLGRPSSAVELGLEGAVRHFEHILNNALESVPDCKGRDTLRALVRDEGARLVPPSVYQQAAIAAALH